VIKRSKEYGITFPRNKIKYAVKDDYFNTWSHKMAYILGFVMADGCIRKAKKKNAHELKVEVNMKDLEVLEHIREEISPTRPIHKNIVHKNKSGSISLAASLVITLTKTSFDRLGSLGVVPRKSGKERIPEELPIEFLWSFVCGLFDGDGCIRKRNRKNQGGYDWGICTSSTELIDQLTKTIPFGKQRCLLKEGCQPLWTISARNKKDIRRIRKKLYANIEFCLSRKRILMQAV